MKEIAEELSGHQDIIPLVGLSEGEIRDQIEPLKQPDYRARQLYNWIHYHNVESFSQMTSLSKDLRESLNNRFTLQTLQLERREIATDNTEKFLWRLSENRLIESVLIPEARRNTICISSQVGCALGCHFCATGQMGLLRNLSSGEIVEQVLQVKRLSGRRITNVVFMGMGEPFMNYTRVIQACKILGDPQGVAIAQKRITISTSGVVPKIYHYTDEHHPYGLAISLHAPNQELREKIMPIAKKFSLEALIQSIRHYMNAGKRNRVTFEYVLLHGVNDTLNDARQLVSLLSPLRCKLNLIPCNQNYLGFEAPPEKAVDDFMAILLKAPFAVTLRINRGEDITAACGQLAVDVREKSIFMKVRN